MRSSGQRLLPLAAAVAAALLGALPARRRYAVVTVAGVSMEPAYRNGERLLVRRLDHTGRAGIGRGSTVVAALRPPSATPPGQYSTAHGEPPRARVRIIKRVVAGPGDPVPPGLGPALASEAGRPVPRDRFVVMGDNTAHSHDSRHIGYVDRGDILAVVVRRLVLRA